ncbi:oxidoreductase [Actinoplanes sp. TBRC 11911]|uniref:oxidoreductase n=1 Tax=Actinoplanes sp. TBRC 11911 TaxID=2729386 RepID=UPI00145DC653|nr:oxidoreductase [Actinoplanes sp. TBRC 11911]NMO53317.1 oxidoreductase [Actinoplanes sp. TBRC 11911]
MTLQRKLSIAVAGVAVLVASAGFSSHPSPGWRLTSTGVTTQFRGLDPVSSRVAWVAGAAGTILRTVDGGRSWQSVGPAAAATLEFRDIEAFDATRAVALTIGTGTDSRLYRTSDGGRSWTETFRNEDPAAFYDCVTFLDARHGLALSDPVDGKFRILATFDGGRSWQVRPPAGMPPALTGEFAFAASGTCLVSAGGRAYFASGGGSSSRVFTSRDLGRTWSVVSTPIPSGPSAGIYSLAVRPSGEAIAVGGDYVTPTAAPSGAAYLRGHSWTVARKVPGEYRSGSAWVGRSSTALAVGPTGSDISYDAGRTWKRFDTGTFDAVACASDGSCWASGAQGRVARLTFH